MNEFVPSVDINFHDNGILSINVLCAHDNNLKKSDNNMAHFHYYNRLCNGLSAVLFITDSSLIAI